MKESCKLNDNLKKITRFTHLIVLKFYPFHLIIYYFLKNYLIGVLY